MKKLAWILIGVVVAAVTTAIAVSYSWTFTPFGRLEYKAAILAKLAYWNKDPLVMDRAAIIAGNSATAKLIGIEKPTTGFTQRDVSVPTAWGRVPVRVYIPDGNGSFPVVVNYHGGGFFAGEGFAFDAVAMRIALRSKVVIFSVDYRMIPEHKFPAAVEDSFAALQWIAHNARSYRGDPTRLAVMGQSAGANLAAVMTIMARDHGGPALRFQYLEVPVVDLSGKYSWPSVEKMGDHFFLKASMMKQINDAYITDIADRSKLEASPLLAPSHRQLPPALIVAAQFDPLVDQAGAYADALKNAGVPVEFEIARGVLHGFIASPQRALENIERIHHGFERYLF